MTTTTTAKDRAREAGLGDEAQPERALVNVRAIERGEDIHLANAVVGGAIGDRVAVSRGLVRHAYGGRSLEVRQGAAGLIATAGGASLEQAAAQAVVSAGSVTLHRAGSIVTIARDVEVERGGIVLLGVSARTVVHEGGRVLLGPMATLALVAGLAVAGAALAAAVRSRPRTTER